jgi:hypothetical protein
MAELVYLLCAVTCLGCAFLLVRSYMTNRTPLLLYSSLCFIGLSLNNILLFVDVVLIPTQVDLAIPRALTSVIAILLLLHGLIKETR